MSMSREEWRKTRPWADPCAEILALEHGDELSLAQQEQLYDEFHDAKNPTELAHTLQSHNDISPELKRSLLDAKNMTAPAPDPAAHLHEALRQLRAMDPQVLAAAERHPKVAQVFLDTAKDKSSEN
jgi:hypothetical protein